MIVAQGLASDGQGLLEKRLGLFIVADDLVEARQVIQAAREIGVIVTQHGTLDL